MKKILIVVDYQNDFVNGSLGFPQAAEIEDSIYRKIMKYKRDLQEVVFTLDTHYSETYAKTQEGRKLPVIHCAHDTEGWELYGRIAGLRNDDTKVFSKYTFGSIDLASYLLKGDYDTVELVGVVTDICVLSNAVLAKAALPEADIVVDANCVASNNREMENKAFELMENLQISIRNKR